MFGLLPPSSSVTGMMFWLAYCMIRRPVVVSPVKAILAIRLDEASGLPASTPKPLTTLRTPGGSRSAISSMTFRSDHGRLLGRLDDHAVARGQRRGQLPHGHQDREVPRDDLADDAERLVEVVGDGVLVDLARCRPPGRGSRRRSSGSGRRPAAGRRPGVSRTGLPFSQVSATASISRLALDAVGDLVQDAGPLGGRRAAPGVPWRRARRPAPARCPRRWTGRPRRTACR